MLKSPPLPPAIFLMGPTASGKTALAVSLVQSLPCEIISVDSALVYRGMDIGTAKPSAEVLARAPHRLIDIRDPLDAYSAANFREDALAAMGEITTGAGKIPLLVGGTGLYFRALSQGLADLPPANPELRRDLEQQARERGWAALHQWLQTLDSTTAAHIHPNDPQRIQRALEVCLLTGEAMSERVARAKLDALPYRLVKIIVAPPDRGILHQRIAARFEQMLDQGLLEEVAGLRQRPGMHPDLPSMRAVGYRQAWRHLAGEWSYAEMKEKTIIATRQLAKRQLTWLRAETGGEWFDPSGNFAPSALLALINNKLRSCLANQSRSEGKPV